MSLKPKPLVYFFGEELDVELFQTRKATLFGIDVEIKYFDNLDKLKAAAHKKEPDVFVCSLGGRCVGHILPRHHKLEMRGELMLDLLKQEEVFPNSLPKTILLPTFSEMSELITTNGVQLQAVNREGDGFISRFREVFLTTQGLTSAELLEKKDGEPPEHARTVKERRDSTVDTGVAGTLVGRP